MFFSSPITENATGIKLEHFSNLASFIQNRAKLNEVNDFFVHLTKSKS